MLTLKVFFIVLVLCDKNDIEFVSCAFLYKVELYINKMMFCTLLYASHLKVI